MPPPPNSSRPPLELERPFPITKTDGADSEAFGAGAGAERGRRPSRIDGTWELSESKKPTDRTRRTKGSCNFYFAVTVLSYLSA